MNRELAVHVSQPTICRALPRQGITRKKTKRAVEQQQAEVRAARQAFEAEMTTWLAADIMAIDEMGCLTDMSRTYGYARRGEQAVMYEPASQRTHLSLLGALTMDGFFRRTGSDRKREWRCV